MLRILNGLSRGLPAGPTESPTAGADPSDYLRRAAALARVLQSDALTTDAICQILALALFPGNPPRSVGIFELNPDNTYSLTATFGLSEEVRLRWQNLPLTVRSPVVDAIRGERTIFVETEEELDREYPAAEPGGSRASQVPGIAVPLRKSGLTVGALGILGSVTQRTEECRLFLDLVASVVAMRIKTDSERRHVQVHKGRELIAGLTLTGRESLIQVNMAAGMTNREIAQQLGYSESTIRQDAVSLFAKLNVTNRREAGALLGHSPKSV